MAFDATILKTFEELPEAQQSEVIDFIMFLSLGHKKTFAKHEKSTVKPFPFNGLKGEPYYVAEDFDEPLDDFKDYM